MKRYKNGNDPRSIIFVSNSDKRLGTSFNFAHPPKWRWPMTIIVLGIIVFGIYSWPHSNRNIHLFFCFMIFGGGFLGPMLMRSLAERQLSKHPGPMGPRTSDGLYAAADLFSTMFLRRTFFFALWISVVVVFVSVLAAVIYDDMPYLKAIFVATFLSSMTIAALMFVFGLSGLFGRLRCVAKKTDILLLPFWGILLIATTLMFRPAMDLCSSLTMYGTHPNGERIAFTVPIADKKMPRSVKGWKAYRGFHDGNAYILVGTNANELSALPVGHKGALSFLSTPLDDDDITIINIEDKCMYRAKLCDGVWNVRLGHPVEVVP